MIYIVLWYKGGRAGSVENTPENRAEVERLFVTSEIQTDVNGTLHLNVLGKWH